MRHKSNNDYLPLQANIICMLLFFVAVILITATPGLVSIENEARANNA